jgi:hypothetical protein
VSLLILGVRSNCVKSRAAPQILVPSVSQTNPNKTVSAAAKRAVPVKSSPAAAKKVVASEAPTAANAADMVSVLTIGHSTRTIQEFVSMLEAHGAELLVDVRSIPKSRRVPQFNSDALAVSLQAQGIEYLHLKNLGGRRHPRKDSVNLGWRNASFRGYADYMATDEFREGLERLLQLARTKRAAIMCAEAVPWRCHRSLIGDALLVQGVRVDDIMSATLRRAHELTSFATVDGVNIVYPENLTQAKLPLS